MSAANEANVTHAQLHRLVYAELLPKPAIEGAFVAADPRSDVEVWRAFARSTLLPLAVGLVVAAGGLVFGSRTGESINDTAPLAFIAGAFAAALAAVIASGKRALLPAAIAIALGGALFGGLVAEVRALRREEQVFALMALIVLVTGVWIVQRMSPAPAPVPLEESARAFVAPVSKARNIAAACVWIFGGPLSFAIFIAFMEERDDALGVVQLVLGLALFATGAVVSRVKRPLFVARHAGLLAFIAGSALMIGALSQHVNVDRDLRPFTALPVLAIGWLAVRSWPTRAIMGAVIALHLLIGVEGFDLRPNSVTFEDDLFAVALAAATTFAMTRGRYVRPVGAAGALALLVFAAVEIPSFRLGFGLALGTFTSLGVIACLIAVVLRVMRAASVPARALVSAVVFFSGFLFIEGPGVLIGVLVVVLARQARVLLLEVVGVLALFIAGYGLVDKPWAILEEKAVATALAAVVIGAVAFTMRRLLVVRS